jgi:hypothetical protein
MFDRKPQKCHRERRGQNRNNEQGNKNADNLLQQPAAAWSVAEFPDADQHGATSVLDRLPRQSVTVINSRLSFFIIHFQLDNSSAVDFWPTTLGAQH